MDWPKMIREIIDSDVRNQKTGYRWSYRSIAEEIGLSKSALGRLATGVRKDPYFTPGKKLVDLYIMVTKQAEEEQRRMAAELEKEHDTDEDWYKREAS